MSEEKITKKRILKKYLATRTVSDKDWKFCEKIDWHPVDELPLKKEFIKKLKRIENEKSIKLKSITQIFPE